MQPPRNDLWRLDRLVADIDDTEQSRLAVFQRQSMP
jgi:hypothetical protein